MNVINYNNNLSSNKAMEAFPRISENSSSIYYSENDYDYDKLLSEYEEIVEGKLFKGNKLITTKKDIIIDTVKKIFLMEKITRNEWGVGKPSSKQEELKSVKRLLQIWFLIYLMMAIPLWCTRGWCCWFLFCNFCNPQRTIEKAKKYLVLNPPGVIKWRKNIIYYNPTDYEKEAYDKFEHIIRTI